MERCHRRITIRVAMAYRTVSTDALLVVTGTPPIDLLAKERAEIDEARRTGGDTAEAGARARDRLEDRWQERWNNSETGCWTRKLIPDIKTWQALTGHGCFPEYLHLFRLLQSACCWYCGNPSDSAEHTIFECDA